jgi:hypothetical protein
LPCLHRKGKDATKPSAAPETHIRPLNPEFGVEVGKTQMTLKPIPGDHLHNMIVEGLSMPVALKEKLQPIVLVMKVAQRVVANSLTKISKTTAISFIH